MQSAYDLYESTQKQISGLCAERAAQRQQIEGLVQERNALLADNREGFAMLNEAVALLREAYEVLPFLRDGWHERATVIFEATKMYPAAAPKVDHA